LNLQFHKGGNMSELPVPVKKKPWLSKTLILNFLVAALALSGLNEKINLSAEQIAIGLTGLNILLRLVTKDKIGLDE